MTDNEESPKITPVVSSAQDYTRYVHFLYLGGIALCIWLVNKIISSMWLAFGEPIKGVVIGLSILISLLLAFFLWRHERVKGLAYEVVTELSKVTWPTRKELYAAVIAVIIVSVITSTILFLFDAFWSWITTKLYAL
jgi:preprotein translocase subunit SecE